MSENEREWVRDYICKRILHTYILNITRKVFTVYTKVDITPN